jgi:hypothetical protein
LREERDICLWFQMMARTSPSVRERLDLPTDEELDAVMDTAEEVMRRFFDMVQELREDIEAERAL